MLDIRRAHDVLPVSAVQSEYSLGGANVTPAQVALVWLLEKEKWIVPIPGTTKLHRFEENIGSVDIVLSKADLSEIESAASQIHIQGHRYSEASQKMIDE